MSGYRQAKTVLLTLLFGFGFASASNGASFVNFETPTIHPLALSPDGKYLAVCNLPDSRLEVFSVGESGLIGPIASIFTGLDPVSVRFQSETEAWVVNHISDSIAIVDVPTGKVVAILNTLQSPEDVVFAGSPLRAFVSCSKPNVIQTFDPAARIAQTAIQLDGDRPKAMCVSPDGSRVFVAIFESGNGSTILAPELTFLDNFPRANVVDMEMGPHSGLNPLPNLGSVFDPPLATNLIPTVPRRVSLIVKKNASGRWMDDSDGDWTEFVSGTNSFLSGREPGWTIADHDIAVIDASDSSVSYIDGLMNICMDVTINPASGEIDLIGTDAPNEVRFEPTLKGIFSRVLLARVSSNRLDRTIVDLNPHLGNGVRTLDSDRRKQSVGDPRAIVWNSRGTRAYVAGMGSNNLRILDSNGSPVGPSLELGGGPAGLAYDDTYHRLYVLSRFEDSISVVDANAFRLLSKHSMHDPTPPTVKLGRNHFYNTQKSSGPGQVACASCHLDGRFDRLAWDLGNPAGEMKFIDVTNRNFSVFVPEVTNHFHPMKGPMMTQTLQDIIGHEPLHWRGDRDGLEDFNPTFQNLQGADRQLSKDEMDQFKAFLSSITFPPNRNRTLSNSFPATLKLKGHFALGRGQLARGAQLPNGNPAAGMEQFRTFSAQGCISCHTLPAGTGTDMQFVNNRWRSVATGTNGQHHSSMIVTRRDDLLPFKIPQLRSVADKIGFDLDGTKSQAGFGFFHDGRVDTLTRFLQDGFDFRDDQQTADMIAFLLCLSGSGLPNPGLVDINRPPGEPSQDVPAGVGRQVAVLSQTSPTLVLQMLALARSPTGRVDLIVKGFQTNATHGWVFDRPSGQFLSDLADQKISTASLAQIASRDSPLIYTLVSQGTGLRLGIDRDGDGFPDQTEIESGSDPSNPLSVPGNEAPLITALADRMVLLGKSISFAIHASDVATQEITFGLESASTPGASIDSKSGIFQWDVPTNQPLGACTVRLLAADNGIPPLTNSIWMNLDVVTNAPPPRLLKIESSDDSIFLEWQGVAGATYVIESAEDLGLNDWEVFSEAISSDGNARTPDLIDAHQRRFYRVRVKQ